jgi:hypothetical protein
VPPDAELATVLLGLSELVGVVVWVQPIANVTEIRKAKMQEIAERFFI